MQRRNMQLYVERPLTVVRIHIHRKNRWYSYYNYHNIVNRMNKLTSYMLPGGHVVDVFDYYLKVPQECTVQPLSDNKHK